MPKGAMSINCNPIKTPQPVCSGLKAAWVRILFLHVRLVNNTFQPFDFDKILLIGNCSSMEHSTCMRRKKKDANLWPFLLNVEVLSNDYFDGSLLLELIDWKADKLTRDLTTRKDSSSLVRYSTQEGSNERSHIAKFLECPMQRLVNLKSCLI